MARRRNKRYWEIRARGLTFIEICLGDGPGARLRMAYRINERLFGTANVARIARYLTEDGTEVITLRCNETGRRVVASIREVHCD